MKIYYNASAENIDTSLVESLLEKSILTKDELRRVNRYYYHPQGLRKCSCCGLVLLANSDNFYVKRYYRDSKGFVTNIGLSGYCVSCDKVRQSVDKARQRQNPELYCKRIIPSLKSRAREQDVAFDLTGENLYSQLKLQAFTCFYSKGCLDFSVVSNKGNHPHREMPSVDRLDPCKGYVFDNVVWTYYFINRAKNDLNLEEFINLCRTIDKNFIQA